MRRSCIQPSHHNHHAFPDHKQGKEESSNMREKRNSSSSSSSSSSLSHGAEKKETPQTTKKLERMPTEEDINASADAFIKNFRQHLLLQRLQSIENYEQMLKRGK